MRFAMGFCTSAALTPPDFSAGSEDAAAELLAELAAPDFASCPDAMLVTSRSHRRLLNVDRALRCMIRLLDTKRMLTWESSCGFGYLRGLLVRTRPKVVWG